MTDTSLVEVLEQLADPNFGAAPGMSIYAAAANELPRRQKIAAALKQTQEAIAQIEERHAVETQKAVEAARRQLKSQLAAASEANDHEAVAEITEQIVHLTKAEAAPPPPKKPEPPPPPAAGAADHTSAIPPARSAGSSPPATR
mgnify:CR=1 FL=1